MIKRPCWAVLYILYFLLIFNYFLIILHLRVARFLGLGDKSSSLVNDHICWYYIFDTPLTNQPFEGNARTIECNIAEKRFYVCRIYIFVTFHPHWYKYILDNRFPVIVETLEVDRGYYFFAQTISEVVHKKSRFSNINGIWYLTMISFLNSHPSSNMLNRRMQKW